MLTVIIILDLIIGIIISIFSFQLEIYIEILIGIGFGFGLLLLEGSIFFIIAMIASIFVSKKKRYHYSEFYAKLLYNYERFVLRLFNVKIIVKNREIVPEENFIIISNHRSNIDSFVLDVVLKEKRLLLAAKKSLFNIPWFGKFIWRNNYLYITREDTKRDLKELLYGAKLANEENYCLGIFPEGKRNFTEEPILPFLNGYHVFLNKTHKPILVCSLKGTHNVNDKLLFKKHIVELDFLELIDYEKYSKMTKEELNEYCSNMIKEEYLK